MRLSSTIFVVLLFSASLSAQTSGSGPTVLVQPPSSHACPVLFTVDRIPGGSVILTNGAPAPPRQGLTLTFRGKAHQIVAADITVHFYRAGAYAIPAAPGAAKPAELTESFHLSSANGPIEHSSIWSEHIAPINWVELTGVEFADGNKWLSSAPRQCGAAPSLFVLVNAAP
jgi:hypothetical protein